jgi:hypothetical protein
MEGIFNIVITFHSGNRGHPSVKASPDAREVLRHTVRGWRGRAMESYLAKEVSHFTEARDAVLARYAPLLAPAPLPPAPPVGLGHRGAHTKRSNATGLQGLGLGL